MMRKSALLVVLLGATALHGCASWGPPSRIKLRQLFLWDSPARDLRHLADPNPAERRWAIINMMRRGDRDAARHIRPHIRAEAEPAPLVRATAARAARRLTDTDAVPILLESHNDPSPEVRGEVIRSLCALKADDGFPRVIAHLRKDPLPEVRVQAADGLAVLGMKEAVPDLIKALEDTNESVRFAAARSLRRLTGVDLGSRPSRWQRWRKEHAGQE